MSSKKVLLKVYGIGRRGDRLYTFKTTWNDYMGTIRRLQKSGMYIRAAYIDGIKVYSCRDP